MRWLKTWLKGKRTPLQVPLRAVIPEALVLRLNEATGYSQDDCHSVLSILPENEREAYVSAYESRTEPLLRSSDPCWEDLLALDSRYKGILASAGQEARKRLKIEKYQRGDCHRIWRVKKQILKEKYGLDWRSPGEMNPRNFFD